MGDPQLLGDEGIRLEGGDGLARHFRTNNATDLDQAEAEALGEDGGGQARQCDAGSLGGGAGILTLGDTTFFSYAVASVPSFKSVTLFCEGYLVNRSLVHYSSIYCMHVHF